MKAKINSSKKKKSNAWYRKKCVDIAKMIAKHRDKYTCVTCGRKAEHGWQMHGSHIFPESKFLRLSVEPDNIMTQCARCHMDWHEHPKGQDWFEDRFPFRKQMLLSAEKRFQIEITKPDYKEILRLHKEEHNKLIK